MKKLTRWRREFDVKIGLQHRQGKTRLNKKSNNYNKVSGSGLNKWIDKYISDGLLSAFVKGHKVTIVLPERLNFNNDLESTALHFNAIRKLTQNKIVPHKVYKLGMVNFDYLKSISTSASLVLTAELSKWDDAIRNRLRPSIANWDPEILISFRDLGFFELFRTKPVNFDKLKNETTQNRHIVKYIKGRCGDDQKTRILKTSITDIIGDEINKWMFLHSGLSEAIVNVSHHAYPKEQGYSEGDKNWYLTASFDNSNNELKVVFYDQGIGIPKSLPASKFKEKLLEYLSTFPILERKRDETLLKAAVQLDRTSTDEPDRGKGLQDLLEFTRQRRDGSLSILSLKGLFELEIKDGSESVRTSRFDNPVSGTLIIWTVIV
ncbi:hypothetical protein [Methylotenera sp. L2L1]|uniref:hypothetical protein n=1 Tax=Methylotenera sp. L2L1 TaxID=1502770 RepID=UPI00056349B4|nr:hypothetical protein [Methylotenera sp. L2L1]